MPRKTHTLDLATEADALDEQAATLHERYEAADDGSDVAKRARTRGIQLDEQIAALEWALEEYGPDATIEVWELTPGEKARYTDTLDHAQSQASSQGEQGGFGMAGIHWVAAAVRDAPWYPDDADGHDDRVRAINDPDGPVPQLIQWSKSKATEVNSLGNPNKSGFAGRVKATRQTSSPE
jgi:hypothetical protein